MITSTSNLKRLVGEKLGVTSFMFPVEKNAIRFQYGNDTYRLSNTLNVEKCSDFCLLVDDDTQRIEAILRGNVIRWNGEDFRPVRNEREKAIDDLVYVFINHYGNPKGSESYINIATAIYDAGWCNKPELVDGYDVHHWSSLAKERFHQFNALETEIIGVRRMVTDTFKHLESGMKYYRIAGTKHDDI